MIQCKKVNMFGISVINRISVAHSLIVYALFF